LPSFFEGCDRRISARPSERFFGPGNPYHGRYI
jgi:hypothetical protein